MSVVRSELANPCCLLMARLRGLVAPALSRRVQNSTVHAAAWIAQPAAFQQACGCVRADAGMLEAGWAAAESAFGPACAAHPRRHVVARRGRGKTGRDGSMGVSLDRMPWCHGGPSRAGHGVGAFATRARCVGGGVGRSSPSAAFMWCWAAGRIVSWSVLVFGAKWFFG
jgi:hypothetical protein